MRILVCGGRDFRDYGLIWSTLQTYAHSDTTFIHGDADGVDRACDVFCWYYGWKAERFPADWKKYGKQAGYIRNKQMLEEGKPDLVIAFPGGKGTEMMIKLAQLRGILVKQILGKDTYYEG